MANYGINKERMTRAAEHLEDSGIDLWLILTSEGNDPCLPLVTGVKTVGPGAFIITRQGEVLSICSSIDAQDIEESGLFTSVIKYAAGLEKPLQEIIERLNPSKVALNYSVNEALCDGLTLGRYRWLLEVMEGTFMGEYVSSEDMLMKITQN